jgi:8-oxo-dGTP diphosphatase
LGAKQQGANVTEGRWLVIPRTLCFVLNGDDVLLMKRGAHKRIFPNQYNGVGGHIERDEDPYNSAIREIYEETGLTVRDVRLCAVYNIDAGEATGIMLYVFIARSDSREGLAESPEGTLHWIPIANLSEYDLVEDLTTILPKVTALEPCQPPYFVHVSYDDRDHIVMRFAGE